MNQLNRIAAISGPTSNGMPRISNAFLPNVLPVFFTGWKLELSVAFALVLGTLSSPAQAASLRLDDFVFEEVSGDFTITGGEVTSDVFRVFQEVTGPDIDLLMSIEGLQESGFIGFQFESVLTNRTDTPWIFLDHELQEEAGTPSPEEDGLSFAQDIATFRPFTSNTFSVVDEVTDVRDFINFSDGLVNPDETVSFRYVILDNDPNDLFFLRQRPNFAPGGVGLVSPEEPEPIPLAVSEPVTVASELTVTQPVASPLSSIAEPLVDQSPTSVPEPGIFWGLFGLMGVERLLRCRR